MQNKIKTHYSTSSVHFHHSISSLSSKEVSIWPGKNKAFKGSIIDPLPAISYPGHVTQKWFVNGGGGGGGGVMFHKWIYVARKFVFMFIHGLEEWRFFCLLHVAKSNQDFSTFDRTDSADTQTIVLMLSLWVFSAPLCFKWPYRSLNCTCAEQLRSPDEVPSDSGYVSSTANSKPSGR